MAVKTKKKHRDYSKLKPKRNPALRLFQRDGEPFGTIDEQSFVAIPDVLLAALALADGKNTLDDIAFHLVKNTAMAKEEMLVRLSAVFEVMEKNHFLAFLR
ncbi:MAG: hypothetical protein V1820_01030 [archaeon]